MSPATCICNSSVLSEQWSQSIPLCSSCCGISAAFHQSFRFEALLVVTFQSYRFPHTSCDWDLYHHGHADGTWSMNLIETPLTH
eukprot:1136791-Pelagomonas_calceolata.AAC.10